MKKLLSLILLMVILSACGLPPSRSGSDATLIYAAIDDEGFNTGTLVVADESGKKIKEINLPVPGQGDYYRPVPTRAPGIILVLRFSQDADPAIFWLNTITAELKQLDFPGLGVTNSFFRSYSARYVVLEGTDPTKLTAKLMDLETASLVDLNALIPEGEMIRGGNFSADENYLLIRTNTSLYLLPTANPNDLLMITDDFGQFMFTPAGDQVIYTERIDDSTLVKTYNIAGKTSEIVFETTAMLALPGVTTQIEHEIILSKKGSLDLLNIQTGEMLTIFEKEDFFADRILKSESGKTALVVNGFDREYFLVDLDTLETRSLGELDGMEFWRYALNLSTGPVHDWAYFVDSMVNPGTKVLKALELDSGKIVDILSMEDEEIGQFNPLVALPFEGSGSFLMSGFNDNYEMRAWAVNSDAKLVAPLEGKEKAMFGLGGISQDGRFGAYSVRESKEEYTVVVIDMQTGRLKTIGPGTFPVWLVD